MRTHRRRLLVLLPILGIMAASCSSGGGTSATVDGHPAVNLTIWSFFSGRELQDFNSVMNTFHASHPWITIHSVPAKEDSDLIRAVHSGTAPDVYVSGAPDDVGAFCSANTLVNLKPYTTSSHIDLKSLIPASALAYTSYKGDQCTLPMLSDAYGLYYNKTLLAAAGYTSPPTTMSQLTAMAEKLTQKNPDGSLKVVGYMPLSNFYENQALYYGRPWSTSWYNGSGKAAFGTDPRWTQMLQWDKSLTDWYGYNSLESWFAKAGGANAEFSASNAFETGKVAMEADGEWRTQFIQSDKAKVDYGTAPLPTADDNTQIYGSGLIGGSVVGIPQGGAHLTESWQLVKYLTTDTGALDRLATLLHNVPTTLPSLQQSSLARDPHFDTFLNVFSNVNSGYKPITVIGTTDETTLTDFIEKFEAGNVSDLHAGLTAAASQVDKQSQLGQ
jgi:multiple sugar transport system substrate-binding protein